jgi:endonuclease/exonuclease/phosphatase family metal-dependent hydrolase
MSIPEPVGFTDEQTVEPRCARFTVLTVNTHKGFTALNRRFILRSCAKRCAAWPPTWCFCRKSTAPTNIIPSATATGRRCRSTNSLADSLWPQFAYGRNAVYPEGDHGNALLSKFQIIRHDNLDVSISGHENRGVLHCVLRLPGEGVEVHAICVHLGLRESHRTAQLKLLASAWRTAG